MPDDKVISLQNWAETHPSGDPKALAGLSQIILNRGGQRLLDGLDMTIRTGGISVLMGPNGAGKTLALRLMARLLQPDHGVVHHYGLTQRDIAVVFQKPVLLRRTVQANLTHALSLLGVPKSQRGQQVLELLDLGQLVHLAKRPARLLSGGEQQRLAMVRALAGQPKLLFLDEPTASLDPQATAHLEELMRQASNRGIKVVLVTHDAGQARRLAEDVIFLHGGRTTEHQEATKFFGSPRSLEARAYLDGRLLV